VGYYGMGDYYRRGEVAALARTAGGLAKRAAPWLARAAGAAATAGTIYEAFKGVTAPSAAAVDVPAMPSATGYRGPFGGMRRRMNVCNIRALRRSLRRVSGFAKVARKVMVFAHPRRGKTHFKFPRRKRR